MSVLIIHKSIIKTSEVIEQKKFALIFQPLLYIIHLNFLNNRSSCEYINNDSLLMQPLFKSIVLLSS